MIKNKIISKKGFEWKLLLEIFENIELSNEEDLNDYFIELDKKEVVGFLTPIFSVWVYHLNKVIFEIEIENFCDVVKKTVHFENVNQNNLQVVAKIDWLIDKKILLGLFYRTLKNYKNEHFF